MLYYNADWRYKTMTYDETMAILDQDPDKHCHEIIMHLDNPDMAVLYVQTQTGCKKEIAQQIVYEVLKDFPAPGSYTPPTPSKPTVTCPYCHSTNTNKISGTTRWLSASIFGLSSNKIGKNFHCKNCGADF